VQPAIDASGRLTFSTIPNVTGTAQLTIELQDDGGTANGGHDTSPPQTVLITVAKQHPDHNAVNGLDVDDDGHVAPGDALAVINYINVFKPGPVDSQQGDVNDYYDVNADGWIAPIDALEVINDINAQTAMAEGEAAPMATNASSAAAQELLEKSALLELLAVDVAGQPKRQVAALFALH
jgi:hypothetical protein